MHEAKIADVVAVEYPYIDFDYFHYASRGLGGDLQDEDRKKWDDFFSADKRKGIGYEASPDELGKFLGSIGLDGDVNERVTDYRRFRQNRRLE